MNAPAGQILAAVVARLKATNAFTGVYNDAPARASFPYVVVTAASEGDWSCKGRNGREIVLEIALWDEQPARLLDLESTIEPAGLALPALADWQVSSLFLLAKKRTRDPAGPWSCALSLRVRLLEILTGGGA